MATDKKLDDAISRWLEAQASGQLPDRVLRATFERTRRSRQQGGWRALLGRIQMPRLVLALSGTAVVVTAAVLALTILPEQLGVAGPPTPTASPAPASFTERFDSTLHGLSISYPSGWQTRPATEPWTGAGLSFDSSAADVIHDPALGVRVYVTLASEPLGSASVADWRSELLGWLCTGGGESWAITVDGATGQAYACTGTAFAALIPKDGRGYLIRLEVSSGVPGLTETYDFDHWFKPMLETVDLRPDDALSPSASP